MSQPGILLMAAGTSRRYRAVTGRHKLLETLPGEQQTLFERCLDIACASGLAVHAVLRPESRLLRSFCAARGVSDTPLCSGGLGESIAAGVRATAEWGGWVVMLADMPHLLPATLLEVSKALAEASTARPFWQGQPGHPVGFRAECYPALVALKGDEGAKALLRRWPPQRIDVNDRGCLEDVDLPDADSLHVQHYRE